MTTVPTPTGPLPRIWVHVGTHGYVGGLITWGRTPDGRRWAGASYVRAHDEGAVLVVGWWPRRDVLAERAADVADVPEVPLSADRCDWPVLPAWHQGGWAWSREVERPE